VPCIYALRCDTVAPYRRRLSPSVSLSPSPLSRFSSSSACNLSAIIKRASTDTGVHGPIEHRDKRYARVSLHARFPALTRARRARIIGKRSAEAQKRAERLFETTAESRRSRRWRAALIF
jgi:hypothetical protein